MTAVSITGIGWVTATGPGWGRRDRKVEAPPGPLPRLSRADVFSEPDPRFGRLPEYSRVGLAAVAFALRDAGLERWEAKRPIGIVASTRLGCLPIDAEYGHAVIGPGAILPSPNLFAYTLPTCFLGDAAIHFGLTGPTWIVNDASGDDLAGVRAAVDTLSWGECDVMVAGHIDLPCGPPLEALSPATAGALFLALENDAQGAAPGYGTLAAGSGNTLSLDGEPVGSLLELARSCLGKFHE